MFKGEHHMPTPLIRSAILAVGLSLLLAGAGAAAQEPQLRAQVAVPRLITFNGVLRDRVGQPLSGTIGVTFSLYKDQEGGAALWSENQNVQLDAQGQYATLLGGTQPAGMPADLFASGDAHWLGVTPQVSGEGERPRILLVSVPYALKAADADTIGGKPASAFLLAPTADQSGSQPSDTTAGQSKSTGLKPLFTGAGTGTSTSDRTVRWTDTAGTLGDGSIQDNNASGVAVTIGSSGNVGINQTSPGAKLQVNSSAQGVDGIWTAASDSHFLRFSPSLAAANYNTIVQGGDAGLIYSNGTISSGGLVLAPWTNGTAGIRMDNNGNVGINQTNPGAKLQVNSGAQSTDGIWTAASDSHFLRFSPSLGPGYYNPIVQGGDTALIYSSGNVSTGALVLAPWANGTAGIRMDNNGNVGINTISPGAQLDVTGNMRSTGTATAFQLVSTATSGTAPLVVNSTTQVANLNASLLGGVPAASVNSALTRAITYLAGCDTCSVLASGPTGDNQKAIFYNLVGGMTINSVTCFSDAGAPVININRSSGGTAANVLSSNLTCSTTGVTSTSIVGAQSVLSLNDMLDFVMATADGVAHRVTVAIKATVN
jgi:hypothetical protein